MNTYISGAATDHSSVFFNVEINTGKITSGTTNAHWYQLGLQKGLSTPWRGSNIAYDIHPDPPHPQVSGKYVPEEDMKKALNIVIELVFLRILC